MDDRILQRILALLEREEIEQAWPLFLNEFAPLILQVVSLFAKDEDDTSECFLFACEQLNLHGCKKLKQFNPEGSATFSTWLHTVVYNLCSDWRRKKVPSFTKFRWISRLPILAQEIFNLHFERGATVRQTHEELRAVYPNLIEQRVESIVVELQNRLSPRQLWRLQIRRPKVESLEFKTPGATDRSERAIRDRGLNPETQATKREQQVTLRRELDKLSDLDRLILQLRFESELTLQEIAELLRFKNAQAVDRQVRTIVGALRRKMQ